MPGRTIVTRGLIAAIVLFGLVALVPWHAQSQIRMAAALATAMLVLWMTEAAPLGVTALFIPIVALFSGILPWKDAVAAWGDPIVFLFLGSFLLARGLDKHAAFRTPWVQHAMHRLNQSSGMAPVTVMLLLTGVLSTFQNNTAVTALLLPVAVLVARQSSRAASVLLALAWGATFGGVATPVGTAPNFIGFAAMKRAGLDVNFVDWLCVGVPAWLGLSAIGWIVLRAAGGRSNRGSPHIDAHADRVSVNAGTVQGAADSPAARRLVIAAMLLAATLWLASGIAMSVTSDSHPLHRWLRTYLPESLVPLACALGLFILRVGPDRRPVLDHRDFAAVDWDTLFLIAGGLCLGQCLDRSGAALALAESVRQAHVAPGILLLFVATTTVLLSELTSNTATAVLMVPIAASLAVPMGVSPAAAILLVSLSASMGFALPVSTPPNAIVFGTGFVPLRFMAATGLLVDLAGTLWLVACIKWFAP